MSKQGIIKISRFQNCHGRQIAHPTSVLLKIN